jgi:hypothetical protein
MDLTRSPIRLLLVDIHQRWCGMSEAKPGAPTTPNRKKAYFLAPLHSK